MSELILLIRTYPRILIGIFILSVFTGYAQTILLSLFNPIFQSELELSRFQISTIYSAATLVGALVMPFIGRSIDKNGFRINAFALTATMILGLSTLAFAHNLILYALGLVLVRASGQSALGLTLTTFLAKSFGRYRGRMLSMISLGRAFCEGIFPFVITIGLQETSRTTTLLTMALSLALFLAPTLAFALPSHSRKLFEEGEAAQQTSKNSTVYQISAKQGLKRPAVWALFFAMVSMPLILTGLFFQYDLILKFKNWQQHSWSQAFGLYALFQFSFNLLAGFLVDRFSARKLIAWALIPFLGGLIILYNFDFSVTIVFAFFGASVGLHANVKNAFLAEAFGPMHLGQIKSLGSSLTVFGTALAPTLTATLLTFGLGIADQILLFTVYAALSVVCYWSAERRLIKR